MKHYDITDTGPNNIYNMENDPTSKEVMATTKCIKLRLLNNPNENFIIFYVIAGHGMTMAGRQIVLLNEFHKRSTFYGKWGVEGDIRDIARMYKNSFQIAFFACCREIMNRSIHSGGFSKADAEDLILQ